MTLRKPITIIGGGLAGLTLGIGLRQRDVPVTLWEAGSYPRHRVCGEFISGHGQAVLERLGLIQKIHQAGAVSVCTAMFVLGANRSPVRNLAVPALGLSRHVLDALLAESFQQLGGELRTSSRWSSADEGEGLVQATGRRAATGENAPRWFGIKAHVSPGHRMALEADLEMHLSPDGYIGVNRINHGEVNICGLFRSREKGRRPDSKQDWLRGDAGSLLQERMAGMEFDPASIGSVAGLQLKPQRAAARTVCSIGDALTMTPPVTGNGMSMAFESAEMAIEPLALYSQSRLDWTAARQEIAQRCDDAFARRLAWAQRLQWLMISPIFHSRLGSLLLRSERLWQFMFRQTR